MNQGCHGATVEMHGTSSISHWVETGLVVSGVEATSIRSILSLDDQLLRDLGGAVRIGLAVLDDDLDRHGGVADLDAALGRLLEIGDDEIVGLGEGGERPGLRRDVAELDRARLRDRRRLRQPTDERGARCGRVFQERAAIDRMAMSSHWCRGRSSARPPLWMRRISIVDRLTHGPAFDNRTDVRLSTSLRQSPDGVNRPRHDATSRSTAKAIPTTRSS